LNAFVVVLIVLALVVWAVAFFHLRGADLSGFDQPPGERFGAGGAPSAEFGEVVASLGRVSKLLKGVPRRRQIQVLRDYLDGLFADEDLGASFTPAVAGGVPSEWVQAPGADGTRRLLYIHGGAFTIGSPRSHRRLTSAFSRISGAAVLAIDYRLMPEHSRMPASRTAAAPTGGCWTTAPTAPARPRKSSSPAIRQVATSRSR